MSNDVTLNVQQLEEVIRKVVREELMAFATQEQGFFYLDKESSLYKDMEDILERKKIQSVEIPYSRRSLEWVNIEHFMKPDSSAALLATRVYANASSKELSRFSKILTTAQNVLGEFLADWICGVAAVHE